MKTLHASFAALLLAATGPAHANVTVPALFGDHMVLQQEMKVPVWGTADPGEKITVTAGGQTATGVAGGDGKWRVDLGPFPDGSPATTLTVAGKSTLTFQDVLIGDVWVCSGQSNMEVPASYDINWKQEQPLAKDPQFRLLQVARTTSLTPLSDITSAYNWGRLPPVHESDGTHPANWVVCNPKDASVFSAAGYFFGKALREHLKRPIGLIESAWGGTVAEAWMSQDALKKEPPFTTYVAAYQQNVANYPQLKPAYNAAEATFITEQKAWEDAFQKAINQLNLDRKTWADEAAKAKAAGQAPPPPPQITQLPAPKKPALPDGGSLQPSNLYNGMIAPLIPFAIKGVAWYQGESNTRDKAYEYRTLFPRLITDWRDKWQRDDLPFVYVQISHFGYAGDGTSALVREGQLQTLSLPKTGMAVVVDIPCDDAGHPRDKEDAGKRLALAAEGVGYGEKIVYSGPLYQSMKVEGGAIRISFTSTGSGLVIGQTPYQPATFGGKTPIVPYPTDKLVGFTIAGEDKSFVPADAKIDGDTVVVSSPTVANPAAVRFAWGDSVQDNLYNKEGLPASPFRTDDWTANFKFRDEAPGMAPPTILMPGTVAVPPKPRP
jgi:sialate O-acetylesterase